jgi:hypothetical protein
MIVIIYAAQLCLRHYFPLQLTSRWMETNLHCQHSLWHLQQLLRHNCLPFIISNTLLLEITLTKFFAVCTFWGCYYLRCWWELLAAALSVWTVLANGHFTLKIERHYAKDANSGEYVPGFLMYVFMCRHDPGNCIVYWKRMSTGDGTQIIRRAVCYSTYNCPQISLGTDAWRGRGWPKD